MLFPRLLTLHSTLPATRSTLTLELFYESCCQDNRWGQVVANIGHLAHNRSEQAVFRLSKGTNGAKVDGEVVLDLRFVSADAPKGSGSVKLKASSEFMKKDKDDLEKLHEGGKAPKSTKKRKKGGFGLFKKKGNKSRLFGQQFPITDEAVVPEIVTSTISWLRTSGLFPCATLLLYAL